MLGINLASFWGKLSPFEIIVSAIAILTGAYTLYKNFWERAKLKVYAGDAIRLVFPKNAVTASRFHLMCNFVNMSTKLGVVHRLEATVKDPQEKVLNFVWNLFYKYEPGGTAVSKDVDPHPIAVSAKDSDLLFIEFELDTSNRNYNWPRGRYQFEIVGWVNKKDKSQRANLKTRFHVYISEDLTRQIKGFGISGSPKESPVYFSIPIEEWANLGESTNRWQVAHFDLAP